MPTPLGYQTENSVRTYPFKDNCSLIPISGGLSRLADDTFIDFQLVSPYPIVRAALTRLQVSTSGYGTTVTITITAYRFNEATQTWTSNLLVVSKDFNQVVPYETITYSSTYKMKIVPGNGLVRLMQSPYTAQLYTFEANIGAGRFGAEFTPSTILWTGPAVTHVAFKNVNDPAPLVNMTMTGSRYLNAGSNVLFGELPSAIGLNVKKGAGTGLYDPCADNPTDVIKSINGVEGEDFLFVTGDCYKTIPLPDETTLRFEHTCRPKCTNTEVNAAAYYENRLQDGINKMGDYVKGIIDALNVQIAAREAAKAAQVISPYIDAQDARTVFNLRNYESIGIGIYDPNKKKMTVNLNAYFSSGIVDETYFGSNPSWPGWVLYEGSPTLREENNTYPLPVTIPGSHDYIPLLNSRGVDCRGSALVNFVASAPTTLTDQWVKLILTAYDGAAVLGTAFKYHNLAPTPRPYFNVRARRGIRKGTTNTYVHTVTIELFDSNPSWSGNTSFSAVVNSVHTVKTPQLRINNGAISNLTTAGKTVAFSNRLITWPDRAVVTFQLEAATTATVNISLTMTVGAQQTVLNNLTFS